MVWLGSPPTSYTVWIVEVVHNQKRLEERFDENLMCMNVIGLNEMTMWGEELDRHARCRAQLGECGAQVQYMSLVKATDEDVPTTIEEDYRTDL